MRIHTEIVNGVCPTCEELTMLVGVTKHFYRCISCGEDLEQHLKIKISYIPTISPKTLKSEFDKYFDGQEI